MRKIPLTQGQVALVDDDLFTWASRWKWYAHFDKKLGSYYARRNVKLPNGKWGTTSLHRAVMEKCGHNIDGKKVDHRNHRTLDNRRSNLRVATDSGNQANRRGANKNNRTQYLGVSWDATAHRARSRITVGRKQVYLGYFRSSKAAAQARDAYIVSNGLQDFYTLNFPNGKVTDQIRRARRSRAERRSQRSCADQLAA